MPEKHFLFGIAGLVVGIVAGILIGGNSSDDAVREAMAESMAEIREAAASRNAELNAEMDETIAALNDRLAQLETSVSESAGSAAGSAEELAARLAELGTALEQGFVDTADRVSALVVASDEGAGEDAAPAEDQAASPDTPVENGYLVGETALLEDGAVRVFVSRVGEESARLSVNGTVATVAVGETVPAGDCVVTLDAAGGGRVAVSADCARASAAVVAPSSEGDAPEGGIPVGGTATFGDGATRVFVSLVGSDSARLSINGVLQTVAVGETVGAGGCSVMLDAVGGGQAAVSADCAGAPASETTEEAAAGEATEETASGEATEEAAASEATEAADDGGEGTSFATGETARLADGALRVFISRITPSGTARLAVNGVEMVEAGVGDSIEVEAGASTCTVSVTSITERTVALEGSCS